MKHEIDLIRALMLDIGARPDATLVRGTELDAHGHDDATIGEHLGLLIAAGYLQGRDNTTLGGSTSANVVVNGITLQGRRFVEANTDASYWRRTQRYAAARGNELSAALLIEIATAISLQAI